MSSRQRTVLVAMVDSQARLPDGQRPITIGGLPAIAELTRVLRDQGYVVTDQPERAVGETTVLWDFGSIAVLPRRFRRICGGRVVAWSLESPLVAHRAYHRLPRIARTASAVLGFAGVRHLLPPGTDFREIRWPNHRRSIHPRRWEDRSGSVMINSYKHAGLQLRDIDFSDPYGSARRAAAGALAHTYRFRRTWVAPDLYSERLRALQELGSSGELALYGVGWPQASDAPVELREPIARSYRGPVADKHEAMSRHRWALCIENTCFPGYVSEKLFDAMFAGAIPVYYGAPDVEEHVPSDTYLDLRDFTGYRDLWDALHQLSATESTALRRSAQEYLRSDVMYSVDDFVATVIGAIRDAHS